MDQCQVHGVMRSFMSPNTDVLVPIQTNATSHHDGNLILFLHDLEKCVQNIVKIDRKSTFLVKNILFTIYRYGGTCLPDWLL